MDVGVVTVGVITTLVVVVLVVVGAVPGRHWEYPEQELEASFLA